MRTLLEERFKPPAWALLWEVGNGTGSQCSRHADALAMSLWPSRGLELVGIEVKQDRSDWVRERDNPAKAEAVARYCDRWYLAVGDESIVKPGELPPTWGLLAKRGDRLVTVKEAPQLTPVAITRAFLAAMFRRAFEARADAAEIESARDRGFKEGQKVAETDRSFQTNNQARRLEALEKRLAEFEARSGLRINEYTGGSELGDCVKLVSSLTCGRGHRSVFNAMRAECRSVSAHIEKVRTAIEALDRAMHSDVPGDQRKELAPRMPGDVDGVGVDRPGGPDA